MVAHFVGSGPTIAGGSLLAALGAGLILLRYPNYAASISPTWAPPPVIDLGSELRKVAPLPFRKDGLN